MAEVLVGPHLELDRASINASGATSWGEVPSADNFERSGSEPLSVELQQLPHLQHDSLPIAQEQIRTEVEANGSSDRTVRYSETTLKEWSCTAG